MFGFPWCGPERSGPERQYGLPPFLFVVTVIRSLLKTRQKSFVAGTRASPCTGTRSDSRNGEQGQGETARWTPVGVLGVLSAGQTLSKAWPTLAGRGPFRVVNLKNLTLSTQQGSAQI